MLLYQFFFSREYVSPITKTFYSSDIQSDIFSKLLDRTDYLFIFLIFNEKGYIPYFTSFYYHSLSIEEQIFHFSHI